MPRYRVADYVRTGALADVLADTPPEPSPVYILYPAGRHPSPRTRAFVDWVSALLEWTGADTLTMRHAL